MVEGACNPSYLKKLRQENRLNSGGSGCSELRSCTATTGDRAKLCLKKKDHLLLNRQNFR